MDKTRRAVQTTIVFISLDGAFVPAGRLDFFDKGDQARANVNDFARHGATFEYGRRYLQRPNAIALDPVMLPLPEPGRPAPRMTTPDGFDMFNGLRDASPDGWGRYLMHKAAPGRVFTEFDYLVASADDRVGALAFGPDPAQPPRRTLFWEATDPAPNGANLGFLAEAVETVIREDEFPPESRILLEAGLSLGGARPKATFTSMGKHWLAKFAAKGDGYSVNRAERAAMMLAEQCGLTVPPTLLRMVADRPVYVIRRFDRPDEPGAPAQRTPFVSALTMVGAHELAAHRYGYRDLAEVIRREGSSVREDLRELFRRMVFNILVGNDDDHLRNHGFLHDGRGWRLAPGYDITPKPQSGYRRSLVLDVGADGKEATLSNALTQCEQFGLSKPDASALMETMRQTVAAHWEQACRDSGIQASEMARMQTCFREAMAAPVTAPDQTASNQPDYA